MQIVTDGAKQLIRMARKNAIGDLDILDKSQSIWIWKSQRLVAAMKAAGEQCYEGDVLLGCFCYLSSNVYAPRFVSNACSSVVPSSQPWALPGS